MPPLPPHFLCCSIAILSVLGAPGLGQDAESTEPPVASSSGTLEGVGVVPKLRVSRKSLPCFLTDEEILAAHSRGGREDPVLLEGVFSIGADASRFAFFWDPVTCRLLGALDLDPPEMESDAEEPADDIGKNQATAESDEKSDEKSDEAVDDERSPRSSPTSPFFLTASGPALFASTAGGSGDRSFFGVRMVEGKPEFLYQQGSLLIEERLWLEHGGDILQQHFALRDMDVPLVVKIPEDWRERVTADRGTWKDHTLTVPKEEASELRLTYRLGDEISEEEPGEKEEE